MVFKKLNSALLVFLITVASNILIAESEPDQSSDLAKAFAVDTEREARNILETLDLSFTQKSEIQSILLAAMQSMKAVNAQVKELEADKERLLSSDALQMLVALHQQRVQLAEMLSVEILSVLSSQQRSQLKLTPNVEPVRESISEQVVREYET